MDISHSASLAAHTRPLFAIRPLGNGLIEYSVGNQDIFDAIALEDTMLALLLVILSAYSNDIRDN